MLEIRFLSARPLAGAIVQYTEICRPPDFNQRATVNAVADQHAAKMRLHDRLADAQTQARARAHPDFALVVLSD